MIMYKYAKRGLRLAPPRFPAAASREGFGWFDGLSLHEFVRVRHALAPVERLVLYERVLQEVDEMLVVVELELADAGLFFEVARDLAERSGKPRRCRGALRWRRAACSGTR